MKFEIENCSGDINKLKAIKGIIEVEKTCKNDCWGIPHSQVYFYKEFNSLKDIMDFANNQHNELIISTGYSEGIVDEKIDGTIKIYDYWNE